jgi:hypothetical protein
MSANIFVFDLFQLTEWSTATYTSTLLQHSMVMVSAAQTLVAAWMEEIRFSLSAWQYWKEYKKGNESSY